ncbi:MAG: LON peptidase substrate-binding domain-containing protein [Singulisphaera sp.]
MDGDELRDFSGLCRLFPLPGVVLFPHVVLPLHIFEPRYRQMTEDALAGDKLVTIVQLQSRDGSMPTSPPAIEDVGCLGRILQHERLPDGRFNFLLLGCKRVRLRRELSSGKLYRVAEAEILEDHPSERAEGGGRPELVRLFRAVLERSESLDTDFCTFLDSDLPLGVLTDILAHAMGLPPERKQALLAESRVDRRVDELLDILRQALARNSATRT